VEGESAPGTAEFLAGVEATALAAEALAVGTELGSGFAGGGGETGRVEGTETAAAESQCACRLATQVAGLCIARLGHLGSVLIIYDDDFHRRLDPLHISFIELS